MSLTPNFTAVQSTGDPSLVSLTDSSTGSDGAITSRRVSFRLANGNYLTLTGAATTQTFLTWPYADATKSFSVLQKPQSSSVTVDWLNVSGTVLYTKTILWDFDLHDYLYGYELLQYQ